MYKIVHGGNVIELATSLKFLRYLPKSKRTTNCDISSANCVQVVDSKNIYAIRGKPLPDSIPYLEALIVQIPLDEYDKIKSILDSNKKVSGSTSALHLPRKPKFPS